MNIVVEGPDNSGKSTLVDMLTNYLHWPVIASEGPTHTRDQMDARVQLYMRRDRTIFDRHCVVSERIYGAARGTIMLDPVREHMFYGRGDLIIYCRNTRGLASHVLKPHDTPDHIKRVEEQFNTICYLYDQWALSRAHIMYRIGDDIARIGKLIKELAQ